MSSNWFPKHMRSSEALLRKSLKSADVIFEVLDARIPFCSRDERIDLITKEKPKIVVLNKCDLSDDGIDGKWVAHYEKMGTKAVTVSAIQGYGIKKLIKSAHGVLHAKTSKLHDIRDRKKAVTAMVVGIPNVGKSTIINAIAGKKKAKIANKPGVTKVKQRVTTHKKLELLDTPGILWPKENEETFESLALIGAIKDEVLDLETLSVSLLTKLIYLAPANLGKRYQIDIDNQSPLEILERIAVKRGCIRKNKNIDYMRVSRIVLGDFRKGRFGKITLEMPEDIC
ncbi:MAG: ribosome biogenesis GTPase YlqF [Deltaproteobacteria bacterium]|nr:ribosome biogenesis GTPase YlqF [Deltaproteobacteria bacterium]